LLEHYLVPSCGYCGYDVMAACDLPKVDAWVRFPLPAPRRLARGAAFAAALLIGACSVGNNTTAVPRGSQGAAHPGSTSSPITHIVVVIQENRTVDNLFQFLPGANTASYGLNLYNQEVPLKPEGLKGTYDLDHAHLDWLAAYNDGAMNGWSRELCAGQCPKNPAYHFVPQNQVQPYYDMAEQYTFGDEMFASNQGPSFPAHQYIVSGTSTNYDNSPWRVANDAGDNEGGCDSPPGTTVLMIDAKGHLGHPVFPCFTRTSIFTLLDQAHVSWRFYEANKGAGPWNAVDALRPLWQNILEYSENVVWPSATVLSDIRDGKLASVVFVTPTSAESDHSGENDGTGPSWVASIVNAIGWSRYWNNTAVVVIWDDWGGWFDHVTPTVYNSYEVGMRVPLIVVSPYAKLRYVSHVPYEFGSILKFIEETFNLGSLDTTDERANDFADCFNFAAPARKFTRIRAAYSADYFLRQPISDRVPDDD
jgi:phospholipase C